MIPHRPLRRKRVGLYYTGFDSPIPRNARESE